MGSESGQNTPHQVVKSYNLQKAHIQQLERWGFEFFKLYLEYSENSQGLQKIVLMEDYEIIKDMMLISPGKFDVAKLFRIFQFGDKFLATKTAKHKILNLLLMYASSDKIDLLPLVYCRYLWMEFERFLHAENFIVTSNGSEVKLDGLRILSHSHEPCFTLLLNLAPFYSKLVIQDLPLVLHDAEMIQSSLQSHLTEVVFDNCPFNFDFCFDLSLLTNLERFKCSNCFAAEHLISMLNSVSGKLKMLDISGAKINTSAGEKLLKLVEQQKCLEELNISGCNLTSLGTPNLFLVLSALPRLKKVNLSNNPIAQLFADFISLYFVCLKWESLDLSNTYFSDIQLIKLLNNLFKLQELESLNISKNRFMDWPQCNVENLLDCPMLKEVFLSPFEKQCKTYEMHNVSTKLTNKIKFYFDSNYLVAPYRDIEYYYTTQSNLSDINEFLQSTNPDKLDFSHIQSLVIDFPQIRISNVRRLEKAFDFFHNVHSIFIKYCHWNSREYLLSLIKNNSIIRVYIVDYIHIELINRMFPLIESGSLNTLEISNWRSNEENDLLRCFFELNKKNFWIRLRRLSLGGFSFEFICHFLLSLDVPNLHELQIYNLVLKNECILFEGLKIYSLEKLTLYLYSLDRKAKLCIPKFLSSFPNVTRLRLNDKCFKFGKINICKLLPNIRDFGIFAPEHFDLSESIQTLSQLSHLTTLTWNASDFPNYPFFSLSLPHLTQLCVNQWIFEKIHFVIPNLRILYLLECDSVLPAGIKKLSKLQHLNVFGNSQEVLEQVTTLSFISHFPNLNSLSIGCAQCIFGNMERITSRVAPISHLVAQLRICYCDRCGDGSFIWPDKNHFVKNHQCSIPHYDWYFNDYVGDDENKNYLDQFRISPL